MSAVVDLTSDLPERWIGEVRWFCAQRGYGVIKYGKKKDIFVHQSAIRGRGYRFLVGKAASLLSYCSDPHADGEMVEFEVITEVFRGTSKRCAVNVTGTAPSYPLHLSDRIAGPGGKLLAGDRFSDGASPTDEEDICDGLVKETVRSLTHSYGSSGDGGSSEEKGILPTTGS